MPVLDFIVFNWSSIRIPIGAIRTTSSESHCGDSLALSRVVLSNKTFMTGWISAEADYCDQCFLAAIECKHTFSKSNIQRAKTIIWFAVSQNRYSNLRPFKRYLCFFFIIFFFINSVICFGRWKKGCGKCNFIAMNENAMFRQVVHVYLGGREHGYSHAPACLCVFVCVRVCVWECTRILNDVSNCDISFWDDVSVSMRLLNLIISSESLVYFHIRIENEFWMS